MGFCLAYLLRGQDEKLSALGVGLAMLLVTWLTQTRGHRWLLGKSRSEAHALLDLPRWAGLSMALIMFRMFLWLL